MSTLKARRYKQVILTFACAAGLMGCTCESASDVAFRRRSQEQAERFLDEHSQPRSTSLKRLGASNGGVWSGRVGGARVLVRISSEKDAVRVMEQDSPEDEPEESAYFVDYFAVLLDSEHPRARAYSLAELSVADDGSFLMHLGELNYDAVPSSVHLFGQVNDGVLQFDDEFGTDGVIPSGVKLTRSTEPIDEDETRLRKYLENKIRKSMGLPLAGSSTSDSSGEAK